MRRLLFDSLLFVSLLVVMVPPAKAQINADSGANAVAEPAAETSGHVPTVSPFRLVDLARNGYFESYGIPSHGALVSAVQTGRVSAEDLVESAVMDRRLATEKLDDRRYLNAVDRFLEYLQHESIGRS